MKKTLMAAGILAMAVMLIIYPQNCLESARAGLNLWLTVVLPSLLPFMTASFMLLETGIVRLIAHFFTPVSRFLFSAPGESIYVFMAAALSGYPVGAKLTGELYARGEISEEDAHSMIRFTSVSGPVFITGAVAAGMLGMPEAGWYLAAAHYISALLTGLLFNIFSGRAKQSYKAVPVKEAIRQFKADMKYCRPFGELLSESVENALKTLLKIGGFIVVFSVVMEMLSISKVLDALAFLYSPASRLAGISAESTKAMLVGGIEFTNGCSAAASLNVSVLEKLPVISSIIAFGGICVHMQTKAVLSSAKLNPKNFVLAKSIQAGIAGALCSILLLLIPINSEGIVSEGIKTAAYISLAIAAVIIALFLIIKYITKNKQANRLSFPFGRKL